MVTPATVDRRKKFSSRLRQALNKANYPAHSPAKITRQFNLRHTHAVSNECVRKWLAGETIPTDDKVQTLADWLNVTVDWLSFGITKSEASK